ncbi:MAG: S41 family peptidase [Planctomycetes bacterium]|nr:S41 family peptidase [Planctomycetota bacterium]
MSFVRRVASTLLAVSILGSGAMARAQELGMAPRKDGPKATIDWVKNYLVEVKNHLKKSFINGKDLKDKDLVAACVRGFEDKIGDENTKLPKAVRHAFLEWLQQGEWTKVTELVAAVDQYLTEHDLTVDLEQLADAGAKEMVGSARDPYSHIFNAEEIQKLVRSMMGEARDESLGLSIKPENGKYSVAYVMYGYVAYEAGIEMGDDVLAVNGKSVEDLTPLEINQRIQAKPGQTVKLTLQRAGWLHPHEFTLLQRVNQGRDVISKLLPGKIGYLRLTIFDMALGTAVKTALDKLAKQGMTGIILDLRHNPGGALNAAVDVADEFIKGKELITKTESNYKVNLPIKLPGMPEMASDFYAGKRYPYEDYPMVVLVDHASASASELLTGALQDLKRARVLGETTYGKGVGQTAIPLWKTGFPMPQRYLYLTVMRYYLPTGRSIHGTGVVPNREVVANRPSAETFERLWALRESGAIEKYLDANWKSNASTFEKLAKYDGYDASAYPNFEGWYQGLQTQLTQDQAREAVRLAVRRRVQDTKNFRYACDLQGDNQLQEALLEMAELVGLEPHAEQR